MITFEAGHSADGSGVTIDLGDAPWLEQAGCPAVDPAAEPSRRASTPFRCPARRAASGGRDWPANGTHRGHISA
jgi:hypothetical protein